MQLSGFLIFTAAAALNASAKATQQGPDQKNMTETDDNIMETATIENLDQNDAQDYETDPFNTEGMFDNDVDMKQDDEGMLSYETYEAAADDEEH